MTTTTTHVITSDDRRSSRQRRAWLAAAAGAAVLAATFVGIAVSRDDDPEPAPAPVERTDAQQYAAQLAVLAEIALERGLTGLSPLSLRPIDLNQPRG